MTNFLPNLGWVEEPVAIALPSTVICCAYKMFINNLINLYDKTGRAARIARSPLAENVQWIFRRENLAGNRSVIPAQAFSSVSPLPCGPPGVATYRLQGTLCGVCCALCAGALLYTMYTVHNGAHSTLSGLAWPGSFYWLASNSRPLFITLQISWSRCYCYCLWCCLKRLHCEVSDIQQTLLFIEFCGTSFCIKSYLMFTSIRK